MNCYQSSLKSVHVSPPQAQNENKAEHQRAVSDLQSKIQLLESKCQAQEKRQEELNSELVNLRQLKQQQELMLKQQQQQQELLQVKNGLITIDQI